MEHIGGMAVETLPYGCSDHLPIIFTINDESLFNIGKHKLFLFEVKWLKDVEGEHIVLQA